MRASPRAGIAGSFAWQRGLFGQAPRASDNSVAVLPFKNLSGDARQDYFSDGLSEELRATLARNLRLLVMAQASSAKFRERPDDAVTIAAKLGVAYLLDGAVRRAGETVRVTADLIDGKTGLSRWSQTFEILYQQAQVLAQWGEHDAAIARLQAARDSGLIYTRNDPLLDPLREDPRFAQLLRAIGFA